MYADRGYLTLDSVNTGQPFDPECVDAEIGHGADQHFFDVANVLVNVLTVWRKADDRITDDLSWAVISYPSAAVYLKYLGTEPPQNIGRCKDSVILRPAAESKGMRVFEEQQMVGFSALDHGCLKLLLQVQGVSIANAAEPADF